MLYRLSYASNFWERRAFARTYPSDPFQMSGTILEGTITVIPAQPWCSTDRTADKPRTENRVQYQRAMAWSLTEPTSG